MLAAAGFYATLDVQKKFELASATGPLLRSLDAETSHRIGILAARYGLFPRETRPDAECLKVQLWGRTFPNPIGEGLAASLWAEKCNNNVCLGLRKHHQLVGLVINPSHMQQSVGTHHGSSDGGVTSNCSSSNQKMCVCLQALPRVLTKMLKLSKAY